MKPHPNGDERPRRTRSVIRVERTTDRGRIIYDVRSILESERAKKHFRTLEQLQRLGLFEEPVAGKP